MLFLSRPNDCHLTVFWDRERKGTLRMFRRAVDICQELNYKVKTGGARDIHGVLVATNKNQEGKMLS